MNVEEPGSVGEWCGPIPEEGSGTGRTREPTESGPTVDGRQPDALETPCHLLIVRVYDTQFKPYVAIQNLATVGSSSGPGSAPEEAQPVRLPRGPWRPPPPEVSIWGTRGLPKLPERRRLPGGSPHLVRPGGVTGVARTAAGALGRRFDRPAIAPGVAVTRSPATVRRTTSRNGGDRVSVVTAGW